jgi:hypothetical protein
MSLRLRRLSAPLALVAWSACSDDPAPRADVTDTAQSADAADATDDADASSDATDTSSASPDATDTAGVCENPCLNEFGKNDKSLCPDPKSEWQCVDGCCEPVFRCTADADCTTRGFDEGQCDDTRFACRCDVGSGTCFEWLCVVDGDCEAPAVCDGGRCESPLPADVLTPRIIDRPTVLTPGATYPLHVEGVGDGAVQALAATWSSSDDAIATVDANGLVTAHDKAGPVTLTATHQGRTASLTLENVLPAGTDLTLVVRTELTWEPVTGYYAVVDAAGAVTTDTLPLDGIIRFPTAGEAPFDVHIFADENDWVSWLDLAPGTTLYLPIPRTLYARLDVDPAGTFTDASQMRNVGIVTGTPDFTTYGYEGALDLVLTTTGLSSALFDFSLPVLLGSDVKRYLHPDANIPRVDVTQPLTLPGGVVFNLAGPAVPNYIITAPRGVHRLWSLGGRLDLNDIAEYSGAIVDAVAGGDLDFTKIVGAVFPLFRNFWSGFTEGLAVDTLDDPTAPIRLDQKLTTPMATSIALDMPPLPSLGERGDPARPTYADGLFLLAGAQTIDGFMLPLGLNGGADTSDKQNNPPDGLADGDERTPEKDPFPLPLAALHSGLEGPHTRYIVAAVAAAIPAGGGDPRPSSGSATLARWAPGERPPAAYALAPFLGFPLGGGTSFENRTISFEAQDGADLQRVLLKGKRGTHWTFYGATPGTALAVPSPAELGLPESVADRFVRDSLESVLINSLDFAAGADLPTLARPGGLMLDLLLGVVERVSFIDFKNQALAP